MVNNGTKAVRKDHRRYSFHRTFGGTTAIPDEFNLDAGLTMPDQDTDGLPMGCTGYALTDVCQNVDKVVYKPRFSYDKSLQIEGIGPDDAQFEHVGVDIQTSLKSGIVYGVQGQAETTDTEALKHRIGDYYDVFDGAIGDKFDAIRSAMWSQNRSVYVGTPWLAFWSNPQQGVIPLTDIQPSASTPWHAWVICGVKKINGELYLVGKTWQGREYGDNGYAYFSRTVVNKVFSIKGSAAFILVPNSGQTIQTVKLSIISTILSYMRLLVTKLTPNPMTAPETIIPTLSKTPMLDTFCTAIRDFEGVPGDLNYTNNNPGNCRCSSVGYLAKYGNVLCVDTPSGKFAKFPTYELGWEYLQNTVLSWTNLHPTWTILDFFAHYAPASDKNPTTAYAKNVAVKCDVPVETTLQDLFK